jgi:hypothetical protein
MCETCAADPPCDRPACTGPGSACACSLAGNPRCPSCGHECLAWFFGMGLIEGPPSINDFLGGAGTENPGFNGYPATKSQLLSAAREEFADIEGSNPADLHWFEQQLPDGTYRDAGEVMTALMPTIHGPRLEGPKWIHRTQIGAIAIGTRLRVPPDQLAVLLWPSVGLFDVFRPGDYVLTPKSAPIAAAHSRAPAPGFGRGTLRASIAFYSTQIQSGRLAVAVRTKPREMIQVAASVRFSVQDPQKLANSPAGSSLSTPPPPDELLSRLVTPSLERALQAQELAPGAADSPLLESTIRSALEGAGLTVHALTMEPIVRPIGRLPPSGFPPEMLANLPPEARAAFQARMEEAMRRRAAASAGVGPGVGSPDVHPASPAVGSPSTVNCPACQAPNPALGKFCHACGAPLRVRRSCPSCGQEVSTNVKFCGNCGARLD